MKKFICFLLTLFIMTGCGSMNNTPTKKVEELLNKYQTNDSEVIADLDDVLTVDTDLTDKERNEYREFMKKHYQDMTYKIKNEKIDGDLAEVEAEISVRNYADVVNDANNYRLDNASKFNDSFTFATYRLNKLKEVTDTEIYTIVFHLVKDNEEWKIDPISSEDERKINGLYGVADVNSSYNSSDIANDPDSSNTDSNISEDSNNVVENNSDDANNNSDEATND